MTIRNLIVAVDSAATAGSGVDVFRVDDLKVNLMRDDTMPRNTALVVTDEFLDVLRGSAEGVSTSFKRAGDAARIAEMFGVPGHILGIPYVVGHHMDITGCVAVLLTTGKRGTVRRVDWARTLRVHRALRRRARRHGTPITTVKRDIRIHAVSMNTDSLANSGGPLFFKANPVP